MDKETLMMWILESQRPKQGQPANNHWKVFDGEHEWEWERVQRRRAEEKCLGGYYRDFINTYAREVKLAYDRERQAKYQAKCDAKKNAAYREKMRENNTF